MKKVVLIIFSLLLITKVSFAQTTLSKITREKEGNTTILHLFFDLTPQYSIHQSGRRVDLTLKNTLLDESSLHFSTDNNIVKFLPLVDPKETVLSFFFRYRPKRIKIIPTKNNSLNVIVDQGDIHFNTHTDIITDLKKSSLNGNPATDKYTNPLTLTPYTSDWRLFFSRYESEVTITTPVQFTLPEFPIIQFLPPDEKKNLQYIPSQIRDLASTNQWNAMEPLVAELLQAEMNTEKKKKLALTYGEVLLRAGNFSGAYKQLYLLEHTYKKQPISLFAGFLLAKLKAEFEDPNLGDYKLKELSSSLKIDNPLYPYFLLLQIETALATNQLPRMKMLLGKDDVPFPKKLEKIRELRQADYWYAHHNYIKAFVGYRLLDSQKTIDRHIYSLNGYCDTLYRQKDFHGSEKCYQRLSTHITQKAQLGMIKYRKAMSELHYKRDYDMMTEFSSLADTYDGTDAGFKAAIKRNDIRFLTKINWEAGTARSYGRIAQRAIERSTSEEAAFKEALVFSLIGKKTKSIDLLMTFLRNYRSGDLIETAKALLLDTLPGELHRLIKQKKYIQALVLAKQNDVFFQKKWLNVDLLAGIATAYHKLGLFKEAENTYRYLIKRGGEKNEEKYYLPLIQVLYNQGHYKEVARYADTYSHLFPNGKENRDIFLLHLKALQKDNKFDEAISLLPSPLPDAPDLQELAATLYFQKNDFNKVIQILLPYQATDRSLSAYTRFILAESLYKQGDYKKADTVYSTLNNTAQFQDQSLFRRADIAIKSGEKEKAVKLLQEIVDKGKDPLWRNLAKKELEYENIMKSF